MSWLRYMSFRGAIYIDSAHIASRKGHSDVRTRTCFSVPTATQGYVSSAIIVAQFDLFRDATLPEVVFGLFCHASLHLPQIPVAPVQPSGLLVGRQCAVESGRSHLEYLGLHHA